MTDEAKSNIFKLAMDKIQEKAKLVKLFRWRSCLKHGLPLDPSDVDDGFDVNEFIKS